MTSVLVQGEAGGTLRPVAIVVPELPCENEFVVGGLPGPADGSLSGVLHVETAVVDACWCSRGRWVKGIRPTDRERSGGGGLVDFGEHVGYGVLP